jgi:hypothetical protein
MARKSKRSMASKSKKKKAKKPARSAARRKGAAASRNSTAPRPVKTGRGPTPLQIGKDFVAMYNQGLFQQIEDKWYSPRIVSVEGVGVEQAWTGIKAVRAKSEWWLSNHTIHGAAAEGPFVGATGFAVRFRIDVETRDTGQREVMDEVAVYTVHNGKIVREEFMYARL